MIDNRIVNLQFNNKQFEEGVKTTTSTLEKLKESLNLGKAAKGLGNIKDTDKSFKDLSDSVTNVEGRFSNMGIVGMTVLSELTKKALSMGKSLYDSTIGQIMSGGKQRALNMAQAEFQFRGLFGDTEAGAKKTAQAMQAANDAVMGTAYGMDAAAQAASQFAATGIDPGDNMYEHLRGIAGVAAMTNSSFEDTARIFTTVSGNGRLMGMQLTQLGMRGLNAAAILAKHMGVSEAAVRDMTSKGQISFEMFSEAMYEAFGEHAGKADETFTGALSNMKAALSRLGQTFWTPTLDNMQQVLLPIRRMIDGIHEVLKTNVLPVFLKVSEVATKNLVKFFDGLDFRKPNEELSSLGRILKAVFVTIWNSGKIAWDVLKSIGTAISPLGGLFGSAGGGVVKFFESMANMSKSLADSTSITEGFAKAMDKVRGALEIGVKWVKEFIFNLTGKFKKSDTKDLEDTGKRLEKGFKPLEMITNGLKTMFGWIKSGVEMVKPIFSGFVDHFVNALKYIAGGFTNAAGKIDSSNLSALIVGLFSAVSIGQMKKSTDGFTGFFSAITGAVKNFGGLGKGLKDALSGLGGVFKAWQTDIQADAIMKIAKAIAVLAASVLVLSLIEPAKLASAVAALTVLFIDLFGSMSVFSKLVDGKGMRAMSKMTTAMMKLSVSILLLSFAVKTMAGLDWNGLAKGLTGVGALSLMILATSKLMDKNERIISKGSAGLILYSTAIRILASSVKALGNLSIKELGKGLLAVGVIMAELTLFTKMTDLESMGVLKGTGLILLATALKMLTKVVESLGMLSPNTIVKGLGALTVILVELAIFLKLTKNAKSVVTTATGLTILAVAMGKFAKITETFGNMRPNQLTKGMLALASSLTILAVGLRLMPSDKKVISISTGLVILSVALKGVMKVVQGFGGMSVKDLTKGMIALATSVGVLAVALNVMSGTLSGAAALTVAAVALGMIAKSIKKFGDMSLGDIVKGLGALVGVIGIIAGTAVILTPLAPTLLLVAGAVAAFAVAAAAATHAMNMFGLALTVFATASKAAMGAIFYTMGKAAMAIVFQIINGVIAMVPDIIKGLLLAVKEIAKGIADAVPAIAKALAEVIKGIILVLRETLPGAIALIGETLVNILQMLAKLVPEMVRSGIQLVTGILQGIAENLPELMKAGVEVILAFLKGVRDSLEVIIESALNTILAFINGLADAIRNNHEQIRAAVWNLISAIIEAVVSFLKNIFNIGKDLVKKMASGMSDEKMSLGEMALTLGKKIISSILTGIGNIFKLGANAIGKLISGIASLAVDLGAKALELGKKIISSIITGIGNIFGLGKEKMTDMKDGMSNIGPALGSAALALGGKALTGIKNGLGNLKTLGTNVMTNLKTGISNMAGTIGTTAKSIGSKVKSSVSSGWGNLTTLGKNAMTSIRTGINNMKSGLASTAKAVGSNMMNSMKSGINSVASAVTSAAKGVASKAMGGVKSLLGIASPSKVLMAFGRFFSEGFASGITQKSQDAVDASEDMGGDTVDAMKTAIDMINSVTDDIDDPVITPVVDIDDATDDIDSLNNSLDGMDGATLSATKSKARTASSTDRQNSVGDDDEGRSDGKTIIFNQTNNSPKALSRLEIYRQTNNQFALAKGVLSDDS